MSSQVKSVMQVKLLGAGIPGADGRIDPRLELGIFVPHLPRPGHQRPKEHIPGHRLALHGNKQVHRPVRKHVGLHYPDDISHTDFIAHFVRREKHVLRGEYCCTSLADDIRAWRSSFR